MRKRLSPFAVLLVWTGVRILMGSVPLPACVRVMCMASIHMGAALLCAGRPSFAVPCRMSVLSALAGASLALLVRTGDGYVSAETDPTGAVLAVVLIPFAEEWLFRPGVQKRCSEALGNAGGILTGGILFALVHVSRADLVPLFLLGCMSGAVYAKSEALLPCCFMHAAYNAAMLLPGRIPALAVCLCVPVMVLFLCMFSGSMPRSGGRRFSTSEIGCLLLLAAIHIWLLWP